MERFGFKPGDLVTNNKFCKYEPFRVRAEDFRGVTAKNDKWFKALKFADLDDFKIRDEFIEKVSDLFSDLTDAKIRYTMGSKQLGGCKPFNLEDFEPERRQFIEAYLNNNNSIEVALKYYEFLKVK